MFFFLSTAMVRTGSCIGTIRLQLDLRCSGKDGGSISRPAVLPTNYASRH